MKKFKILKGKNVFFTALKITNHTDKMFKIMGEAFGKHFVSTDKKLPSDLLKVMLNTMSKSITESKLLIDKERENDTNLETKIT